MSNSGTHREAVSILFYVWSFKYLVCPPMREFLSCSEHLPAAGLEGCGGPGGQPLLHTCSRGRQWKAGRCEAKAVLLVHHTPQDLLLEVFRAAPPPC